jgi:hypothetical protein
MSIKSNFKRSKKAQQQLNDLIVTDFQVVKDTFMALDVDALILSMLVTIESRKY